jgi:3-deoxy-7-phosphoheptulonate synthase
VIAELRPAAHESAVGELVNRLVERGGDVVRARDGARRVVALVGECPPAARQELESSPLVARCEATRGTYVSVARAFKRDRSVVAIGTALVGGPAPVVIGGPCSVESSAQVEECAHLVARAGCDALRGGAHKPRTHPYAFRGLGREGLRMLKRAGEAVGLPVLSEIMDADQLASFVDEGIDCLQIGARNMQNFTLLERVASAGLPVLLKRGAAATVEEWLCAAEYLAHHGSDRVVLCERGIRTYEPALRNTLDLAVVPLLRRMTHLPIVVDPSHAVGRRDLVRPTSRAAIAVGADGIVVEMHPRPEEARSDGPQALLPEELASVASEARILAALLPTMEG